MLLIIVFVALIVVAFGGGIGYRGGSYRNHGMGLGGFLLIVLAVLILTGAFH